MSEIQRICAQCGQSGALDTRYCPHCGYDVQAGLPAPRTNLPVTVAKAALPILAGVAGLAVRAGWRLLQSRLAQAAVQTAVDKVVTVPRSTPPAAPVTQPKFMVGFVLSINKLSVPTYDHDPQFS